MLHMHDADIKPRMHVRIILCYGLPNASINICDLIGTACLAQAITVRLHAKRVIIHLCLWSSSDHLL